MSLTLCPTPGASSQRVAGHSYTSTAVKNWIMGGKDYCPHKFTLQNPNQMHLMSAFTPLSDIRQIKIWAKGGSVLNWLRQNCLPTYENFTKADTHVNTLLGTFKSSLKETMDLRKREPSPCCTLCVLSCVWLLSTPWTVACQVPLFTELSMQEYWSGLPFPPSRGSFQPRDWTWVSWIGRCILYHWAISESICCTSWFII